MKKSIKNKSILEVIKENENLIWKLIHRYFDYLDNDEKQDFFQQAIITLIQAHKEFNEKKKTKFSTYLWIRLRNDLLDYKMKTNLVRNPTSRKVQNQIEYFNEDEKEIEFDFDENILIDEFVKYINNDFEVKVFTMLYSGYNKSDIKKMLNINNEIYEKTICSLKTKALEFLSM